MQCNCRLHKFIQIARTPCFSLGVPLDVFHSNSVLGFTHALQKIGTKTFFFLFNISPNAMTSTDKFEVTFILSQLNTGKMKVTFALVLFYFHASKFLYVLTSSLRSRPSPKYEREIQSYYFKLILAILMSQIWFSISFSQKDANWYPGA